ncbi:tyrosine-type recombinase/integrase [Streptomyces sp. NPDC127037]|uniref:tyrosine-type recombinase/integrase n=1 Tax=Streptomyces sp. NPDC127037 TaxID=3347113 RepID=UPI00364BA7E9
MASVHSRKNKAGEVSSYQVKWRLGGGRDAPWQTEKFDDEPSAEVFRDAVNEHGQQWPPGWVKGRGYIDPGAATDEECRFDTFARESIKNRTGIEERYRRDCYRDLENYILPTFAHCDVRSTDHFSSKTVRAWVNQLAQTKVWRGSKHKTMSPKTLKNLHGLLSSILNEAVQHEPPLRARNPCELTRLPRADDDGVADGEGEDMEFLTPEEVAGIVSCLKREGDRRFVRVAYGTGMRWGEITALARRHALNREPGRYQLKVARAWKLHPDKGAYLGVPKSQRSRRTIEVSAHVWQELVDHGIESMGSNVLIFQGANGRLVYSTFYDRWIAAVKGAKEAGLLPDWKYPTFHDLRHSHVAALLSDGHGLTYIQRRLGHESIKTTSDRYGHLLPHAHSAAMATIDRSLGYAQDVAATVGPYEPAKDPARPVFVARLGTQQVGFWDVVHAEEVAQRWATEHGGSVDVQRCTADWWVRTVGNGTRDVRDEVPERAFLWFMGPAVYAEDGTELASSAEAHTPQSRWVWEFEDSYTDEPALSRAEWRWAPQTETEAAAWGMDQDAVRAAYAQARTDALRICSLHPARGREASV